MENGSFLVSEELNYHRAFMRTNREPSILDVEPIVESAEVVAFVSDVLDYAFFVRKIEGWISPYDSGQIQRGDAVKKHFNFDIGDSVTHACAIQESFQIAKENGFNEKEFLELPFKEALDYAQNFIEKVLVATKPLNISFLHALAFACTLCGIASENFQLQLMNSITYRVVSVFQSNYPYEWIYYDFTHWAICYIIRHQRIHDGCI